jgi:hypothetical protein
MLNALSARDSKRSDKSVNSLKSITIATVIAGVLSAVGVTGAFAQQDENRGIDGRDAPRLQGQVPLLDQLSGRALLGYTNGIELVGSNGILNRLNNGNLGWVDECAYVSAYFGSAIAANSGMAVIDASNPTSPSLFKLWPGTPGARESQIEGNQESRMVVVMPFPRATFFGDAEAKESILELYDAPKGDCRALVKRGVYRFGDAKTHDGVGKKVFTHEHRIWKDIIYVTAQSANDPGPPLYVIDATDRDNPKLIATWDLSDETGQPIAGIHDMDISPDGKRVYGNIRVGGGGLNSTGGLVVLDTSEVANWKPGMAAPKIKRVSDLLLWNQPLSGQSHTTQFFKNKGRNYVAVANEGGGCPAAHAQIVDVTYEAHPVVVSTMRLQVNLPENCDKTLPDHDGLVLGDEGGTEGLLGQYRYGAHYSGIDNVEEGKILAITWYSSGLHLFDVSDPYSPKHVGEFNPPARSVGTRRALMDRTYSFVRFHKGNIWFTSANGGFWIVKHKPEEYDPGHKANRVYR